MRHPSGDSQAFDLRPGDEIEGRELTLSIRLNISCTNDVLQSFAVLHHKCLCTIERVRIDENQVLLVATEVVKEVLHTEILTVRQRVVHFRDPVRKETRVLLGRKHLHMSSSPILFNGWGEQRQGIRT